MAYVPPHKRHSKGNVHPIPVPEMLAPLQLKKNLNLGSFRPDDRSWKIVHYDTAAIYRWFAVGLEENDQFPPSVRLQPVSVEATEQRLSHKPLALVNSRFVDEDDGRVSRESLEKPWVYITERVMQELLPSFEVVRSEIESGVLEDMKPCLVARVGKVLFRGNTSSPVEDSRRKDLVAYVRRMTRFFYTNLPSCYLENILNAVIPNINLKFKEIKDVYHVRLSDTSRPDSTVSCKCRVMKEDNTLELYKIKLNQVRHMVCDISCLNTNLDLRLMLCSKRILAALSDQEQETIKDVIQSAILDPKVEGGLRWPLGKGSSGDDRYRVVGVWHAVSKTYSNPLMGLKVRDADRFNFKTSIGEVTQEITLKLNGIASQLMGKKLESGAISDMLEDAVKLLWEHFLNSSGS